MEHSVEMQSGLAKEGDTSKKDQTEMEVRRPPKIDLKSVLAGFSSAKTKGTTPTLSSVTPLNDVTTSQGLGSSTSNLAKQGVSTTYPSTYASQTATTTLPPSLSSVSLSSSSKAPVTTTTTNTTTTTETTTATTTGMATNTTSASTSLSIDGNTGEKTENGGKEGESKTEGQEEEPFVMTPQYERLAKLLARKRANAVAAAAAAATSTANASGSGEGTTEGEGEAFPQQSHWSKLRTTVQIASVVKQRSKRRYNHHRQDSFLRKFSTRHNSNLDQDSDSEDNEAVTQEIEKEVEQKRLYRYVISPEGTLMMYWLFILTLAVLYNLWTCIAREAFREIQLENITFWITFDVICDVIYLSDILVQFRTGYLEQGLLVYDSKKLAKNYMSSVDFKFDVACLLPLDFLQVTISWHPILRFPRFLKIYRTFRCVHMLESRTPYPNLFRVANLTHILFLGAHWFAAFFYLISEAENFVGNWTYPKPVGEFAGVTRKYLYSLFWSTLTLTTIGDLPQPTTNWEFVFVIFSYLIGVFIFATIVGQVGNVITNRNASRQEFEKLLDGAKFYMQSHNVPKELQKRVQRWYDYVWSRGRLNGSLDIGSLGMLPDKLKTELALNVNLDTLKKVTIFQECQPEFLHDLVLKMKAHIFTPGDLICRSGEVAREMFIIADGVVEVISDRGTVLASMSSGDFFGEIGILNLHGGINRRTADVRSLGYSELFVLSREDVLAALKDQPDAEHIIREYGEKRLKEIEAHNKRNSDPTPSPSPGSAPKKPKPTTTENSLQVGPVKKNKPLRMSNLDKPTATQNKEPLKSKTASISKRLRDLPLGRSIAMATSGGTRSSGGGGASSAGGGGGNDSRFHRLWKGNWSKIFSSRKGDFDSGQNVHGVEARSAEIRRTSSSNSSSSPETRTRKSGVAFAQDIDGSKEEAGGIALGGDGPCRTNVFPNRKKISNRLSNIINQHKISHGAKYSAVKPDTSDSDSAHTDLVKQPLTKPAESVSKKDNSSANERKIGGFASFLSAGFRRNPNSTAKVSEAPATIKPTVPHISLTVSSPPLQKHETGHSSKDQDTGIDTKDQNDQSSTISSSQSATVLIEDINEKQGTSEGVSSRWPLKMTQIGRYTTTVTTTPTTTLTTSTTISTNTFTTKTPIAGSVSSLPGSISSRRSHLTSIPASSSVQAFSSSFSPSYRGSCSFYTNPSRSATSYSFTSASSFYTASTSIPSRPPITQSYSFSSSNSPSFYSCSVSASSSNSTPNVASSLAPCSTPLTPVGTSNTPTPATATTTTTTAPTTTTLISAPISGNKFSLLAGRRRGAQHGTGLRSSSLEEYRTPSSTSEMTSHMVTSSSTFWSPTPAAPPPSYYSSYSVSSSYMHPQVNRWIPSNGSTLVSPLGSSLRSSATAANSIENNGLIGQQPASASSMDATGKGRKETITTEQHWHANQVVKDIQKILDEKIVELQRVYQDSLEQYSQLVRHQDDRIKDLERQLKNLQAL